MKVVIQDVKRKEVDLTEVFVGSRLMYVVESETKDRFHVVDPFMVITVEDQPTKLDAVVAAISAVLPNPVQA